MKNSPPEKIAPSGHREAAGAIGSVKAAKTTGSANRLVELVCAREKGKCQASQEILKKLRSLANYT